VKREQLKPKARAGAVSRVVALRALSRHRHDQSPLEKGAKEGESPVNGRGQHQCVSNSVKASTSQVVWEYSPKLGGKFHLKLIGEPSAGVEPGMSECGNAHGVMPVHPMLNP
jgi:hypothetical protein